MKIFFVQQVEWFSQFPFNSSHFPSLLLNNLMNFLSLQFILCNCLLQLLKQPSLIEILTQHTLKTRWSYWKCELKFNLLLPLGLDIVVIFVAVVAVSVFAVVVVFAAAATTAVVVLCWWHLPFATFAAVARSVFCFFVHFLHKYFNTFAFVLCHTHKKWL